MVLFFTVGAEDEPNFKNVQLSYSGESDDNQSDYLADVENSSCSSLELDSDWSDSEDRVEPVGGVYQSIWLLYSLFTRAPNLTCATIITMIFFSDSISKHFDEACSPEELKSEDFNVENAFQIQRGPSKILKGE